jgi:hypothetical protein
VSCLCFVLHSESLANKALNRLRTTVHLLHQLFHLRRFQFLGCFYTVVRRSINWSFSDWRRCLLPAKQCPRSIGRSLGSNRERECDGRLQHYDRCRACVSPDLFFQLTDTFSHATKALALLLLASSNLRRTGDGQYVCIHVRHWWGTDMSASSTFYCGCRRRPFF